MKLLITVMILLVLLMCSLPPLAAKFAEEVHVSFGETIDRESVAELPPLSKIERSADNDETVAELASRVEHAKKIAEMSVKVAKKSEKIKLRVKAPACVRVLVSSENTLREMSWEEYLAGVVLAEMYVGYDEEALKAQVVACHSYALYRMGTGYSSHKGADVCTDSGHCTAYQSYEEYAASWGEEAAEAARAKISQAVCEVADYVLTYDGAVCNAMFHASSGDRTESAASLWDCELPYLSAVTSFEENEQSEVCLRAVELERRLAGLGIAFSGDPSLWIEEIEHTVGGRVDCIRICGNMISGNTLRSRLGLRSTDFTVDYVDGNFFFTVTGYGHGIGMSQAGAAAMAKSGADWRAILAHYYVGSELAEVVSEA